MTLLLIHVNRSTVTTSHSPVGHQLSPVTRTVTSRDATLSWHKGKAKSRVWESVAGPWGREWHGGQSYFRPSFPVPSAGLGTVTALGESGPECDSFHGRREFILWQLYQPKLRTLQQAWHVDVSSSDLCQADKQPKMIPIRVTGKHFSTELAVIVTFGFPQAALLRSGFPPHEPRCYAL